jgi:hypothetical protein
MKTDDLETRLAKLERRVHSLLVVSGVLLTAVATLLLSRPGQTQTSTVEARGGTKVRAPFTVVDNRGRTILRVGVANGGGGLLLNGAPGKPLLQAGLRPVTLPGDVTENFSFLSVNDPTGMPIADISDEFSGNSRRGVRGLHVYDWGSTNKILSLGQDTDSHGSGEPRLQMSRTTNSSSVFIAARPAGGRITLADRDGNETFTAPAP